MVKQVEVSASGFYASYAINRATIGFFTDFSLDYSPSDYTIAIYNKVWKCVDTAKSLLAVSAATVGFEYGEIVSESPSPEVEIVRSLANVLRTEVSLQVYDLIETYAPGTLDFLPNGLLSQNAAEVILRQLATNLHRAPQSFTANIDGRLLFQPDVEEKAHKSIDKYKAWVKRYGDLPLTDFLLILDHEFSLGNLPRSTSELKAAIIEQIVEHEKEKSEREGSSRRRKGIIIRPGDFDSF